MPKYSRVNRSQIVLALLLAVLFFTGCFGKVENSSRVQTSGSDPISPSPAPHASPAQDRSPYRIVDLGAPSPSLATSINDSGVVVGEAETGQIEAANGERLGKIANAFLWNSSGFKSIGALPIKPLQDYMVGVAYSVNRQGAVVGGSGSFGPGPMDGLMFCTAFIYKNGNLSELMPSEPGTVKESEQAFGINDLGTVVGSEPFHGFAYLDGKQIEILPLSKLEEGNGTVGVAVNNDNEVVGATTIGKSLTHPKIHAFLWRRPGSGAPLDLGTLPRFRNSIAVAINSSETVVGYTSEVGEESIEFGKWVGNRDPKTLDFEGLPSNGHAFVWHRGIMRDLRVLPHRPAHSAAFGINNLGTIVGTSGNRAAIWIHNIPIDLNSVIAAKSGWTLVQARAINNRGWIAGWGMLNGHQRAFVLIPK